MILYFSFPSLWIVFGDTYRCSSLCPFSNNYYLKSFWKVKMNAKWKFFISFTFWTTIQHNSPCICRNSCKWSTPNPLSNLVTFCRNVKNVKLPSCVRLFATPLTGSLPARLLCPWDFPGKNTGVGCHFLLQENLLNPVVETVLPRCRQTLPSEPPGKPWC